jgi:hypothetical protein
MRLERLQGRGVARRQEQQLMIPPMLQRDLGNRGRLRLDRCRRGGHLADGTTSHPSPTHYRPPTTPSRHLLLVRPPSRRPGTPLPSSAATALTNAGATTHLSHSRPNLKSSHNTLNDSLQCNSSPLPAVLFIPARPASLASHPSLLPSSNDTRILRLPIAPGATLSPCTLTLDRSMDDRCQDTKSTTGEGTAEPNEDQVSLAAAALVGPPPLSTARYPAPPEPENECKILFTSLRRQVLIKSSRTVVLAHRRSPPRTSTARSRRGWTIARCWQINLREEEEDRRPNRRRWRVPNSSCDPTSWSSRGIEVSQVIPDRRTRWHLSSCWAVARVRRPG